MPKSPDTKVFFQKNILNLEMLHFMPQLLAYLL